jgi:hypothetical protein
MVILVLPLTVAQAYGPTTLFKPSYGMPAPGSLYARAAQTEDGRMYATFEQYSRGVSVFPIYESLNNGMNWTKVGEVKDTHKGVGMRWEPHLYELPESVGNMPKGTLLCAGAVVPSNRSFIEIDLYKSNDRGRNWTYVSTIAEGKSANPGSDPVWEPCLIEVNHKLICYYSDERDPRHSQKIVHQTTTDGIHWSNVVDDVALSDSGQRPGMPVVAKMNNGNYIMTYEIIGIGGAYYQISSNPEKWNVTSTGTKFANGACPYCCNMNGTVVLSSSGSNNLLINSNNGIGQWKEVNSTIPTSYSRCLVPLKNGRLFEIGAGFNGNSLNDVIYGDLALPGVKPNSQTNQNGAKLPDGWYYIKNVNAQKYLSVEGDRRQSGTNVELRTGNGQEGQKWYLKNVGNGYVTLTSALGEYNLDVNAAKNEDGTNIEIYNAHAGYAQQFMLKSGSNGAYVISTKCSNLTKVLDDSNNNKNDGANVCQWSYNGGQNQQWIFEPVNKQTTQADVKLEDGWYCIKNINANKYLQVQGNKKEAGANVELRSANGSEGQRWYLQNLSNGFVTLKSALGNFMIDVSGAENKDGANIQIYHGYSGDAQQFKIKSTNINGEYTINTKCSDLAKVFDDSNFNKNDGANICQWTYSGQINQRWKFEKC